MTYPEPKGSRVAAYAANLLKIIIAVGIVYWLVVSKSIRLEYLYVSHENIYLLIYSILVIAVAVNLSALRIGILLRGAGIGLGFHKCLKINIIMYFFSQCVLGAASGDVARFFYIMRETGHKAEAGAAVLIDRIIGLMGLFMLAGLGMVLNWQLVEAAERLRIIATPLLAILCFIWLVFLLGFLALVKGRITALVVGCGISGCLLLLCSFSSSAYVASEIGPALFAASTAALIAPIVSPEFAPEGFIYRRVLGRSRLGSKIADLTAAVFVYRNSFPALGITIIFTAAQHLLMIYSLYLFSQVLNLPAVPDFGQVFFAGPPAFLAGIIPAPAAGLGVNEAAFDVMLELISNGVITAGASIYLMQRIWLTVLSLGGLPFIFKLKGKTVEPE
ncbi:lysylphosphatidylglycerol synthase transmembrane domain-containing protein [Maridesulfovibrio sp.]|uniref:lysylphosphatidylglycerol synthase transmembrane domain-containing protein n=1 Tax=Maridesulfovibrio sp. TaxID=2795000 RepID=UPI002A18C394|nr:lysylphosphatidylglycerol synthase transmembrane domain-containing protein [Maridesulfovibrio sp.]